MEYVIYDNLDYDAYKETARENLEANGNADPTEEELSFEVDFLMQNDWQDTKVDLIDFFKTDTWLARGTFDDWTGGGEGGLVFKSFEKLYEAVCRDCDYVRIWDEDGHFHMSGTHHDGTNHVEVVKLSKKGKDIWYEWKAAGEDSDLMNYSRRAIHKLLAERYSDLPNYAKA